MIVMSRVKTAVLGVTGMVGQQYVRLLEKHPWFKLELLIGGKSAGKLYGQAVEWVGEYEPPREIMEMPVKRAEPEKDEADLVFSCLPTEVARDLEPRYAKRKPTISDASAFRMEPDVPLIIPEVNLNHLALLNEQKRNREWAGCLVTSPNCTVTGLAMVLKPLHEEYRLRKVVVATLQALSGAGYPGVPALRIVDNIIPYIKNEEEKIEKELRKLLGRLSGSRIQEEEIPVASMVHRVPTIDGHLESVYIEVEKQVDPEEAKEVLREYKSEPQELKLPTAPERPIIVREEEDRPQPRLDRNAGTVPGMSVVVGRVRRGLDNRSLRLTLLSHNTVRGAAGNAILIAEAMYKLGYVGGG